MPINTVLATEVWNRYAFCRDNGHSRFVEKAETTNRFFAGDQWSQADKDALERARRPALTINKILSTLSNVMGEQIYNRAEVAFRPKSGAPSATADILTKVFKHISDQNQLAWKRSDMFTDGIITSRGYLDARIDFGDNMRGEVVIDTLNPKNVVIDPDAEQMDPDTWNDVMVSKWLTADDIAVLYSKKDADLLRGRSASAWTNGYGYDAMDTFRDRVGGDYRMPSMNQLQDDDRVIRNIRVIERQYRKIDRQEHFLFPTTGDTRPIPKDFDRNRIAYYVDTMGLRVIKKMVRRIRWSVVADNVELHDDWSPYKHFTVVPYFPYFRHGKTIGLVENLLGPQEYLNKVTSQELHVVNTTANSGYIVQTGAMVNMTTNELEQRGAETGLVIEVNGDVEKAIKKILPNSVPTGLDRLSYKGEEHIKSISGVSDSMQGQDRADVAAKAIQAKKQAGSVNLVKPMDSLTRSDFILARNVLDLVQEFYSDERVIQITHDDLTAETEEMTINQVDATGQVVNDLTLGEYSVVVVNVPHRETLEDSQFDQAVALKELGVSIPDSVLLESSRLQNKSAILKQIQQAAQSEEALAAADRQRRAEEAEVQKVAAEAKNKDADAVLKDAKAQKTVVETQVLANTPIDAGEGPDADPTLDRDVATAEMDLKEREFEHKKEVDFMTLREKSRVNDQNAQLKAADQAQQAAERRAAAVQQAAQQAQSDRPASKPAASPSA